MKTANLILNGELDLSWLWRELAGKNPVYCADGAYDAIKVLKHFSPINIEAVIGDMDSISDASQVNAIRMPDQEYTDFEKSLQHLSKKFKSINIYGASGKDMDHFLGNLSAAKKYKDKIQMKFLENGHCYYFMEKDTQIETEKGMTISILPFPKAESVTTEGLEYALKEATLELGKQISVRNKAKSNKARIKYKEGCAILFVYTKMFPE